MFKVLSQRVDHFQELFLDTMYKVNWFDSKNVFQIVSTRKNMFSKKSLLKRFQGVRCQNSNSVCYTFKMICVIPRVIVSLSLFLCILKNNLVTRLDFQEKCIPITTTVDIYSLINLKTFPFNQ